MPADTLKARLEAVAVRVALPAPAATPGSGAEAPAPPPAPAVPVIVESARGSGPSVLDVTVPPERIVDATRILDEAKFMLEAVGGIDWLAQQQIEIAYDYTDVASGRRVVVRTRVPRAAPELPTISGVYPGANWHERETHDFFGVVFTGHPDLSPLLLPEDATFHPLRKDFAP